MEQEKDYSYAVYRSLMKRKLVMGVPLIPLLVVVFLTAIFFIALESLVIVPFSILLIIIMRMISKNDEYLLEIFLISLLQPDSLN